MDLIKFLIVLAISVTLVTGEDVCYKETCQKPANNYRFLFYDVNPSEGFNLRRDVYMRMAVLANKLKNSQDPNLNSFLLVLPPWSHLMHWPYSEEPEHIPWSMFFDINSLNKFAPVIELHQYFALLKKQKYTKCILDEVYVLQHFEDMFESGNFEEKWLIEKCQKPPKMKFFYYANITASNVKCLSFHGPATKLAELFKLEKSRTLMLERAEVALHDTFGNDLYWKARRSMRFNRELRKVANDFRIMKLDSNDEDDLTTLPPDWRDEKPKRNAKGGPYLAVHMRRRDFLRGRADKVPDLLNVAKQISKKLNELKLAKVFIATDAPRIEFEELNKALSPKYEVYKYQASKHVESKYSAGGIAIIDQIICSYARYFIGTSDSTFSFRIQEEREILGFPTKSTFNVLCKNNTNCEKPSVWKIVY
ncbi:GDP-fucose protein O-fucosyltransferase 2 isoform X2 [Dendroctonus ponderosae]|uniref:GDP-fucose protein O-fucosyltransferase 2 isoform X2 n=1 Tax=Dendroctonus ponderosae TaxID=77166 RepID=UPI002035BFDF|nr:GDP-fucose protein O-fucosyltransferase 2 isoform X2 [Dendroctonus ponderosae]